MANTIKAGNTTGGFAITPDQTGILELKTGTLAGGTTAMTIDASQNATLAAALTVVGAITSGGSPVANTASFQNSLTATGYQKLPGGLIIQWLYAPDESARSWAIPFPTAVLCAVLGPVTTGGVVDNMFIASLTTTSVTLGQNPGGAAAYVIGIGY